MAHATSQPDVANTSTRHGDEKRRVPRNAARAFTNASFAVGVVVALIAVAANLGTAYEHACKYTKYCAEALPPAQPAPLEPSAAKKDVIVVVCNVSSALPL